MTIPFDAALVSAFFLALLRASAWLISTPPFANRSIPGRVKAGFAAALALVSAPMIHNPPPFGSVAFVNSAVLQLAVGFALGLITQLLFAVFQTAGSLIDVFAGYSIAMLYDPMADTQNTIFGRIYSLIGVTLFFVTGACTMMVKGFIFSFRAIPASGISLANLEQLLTRELGMFMVAAIEIAAPVLVTLFLTELVLGILAKASPSLNVFALGFPLRVIVAITTVMLAIPLLLPAASSIADEIVQTMRW
ncbi:MAG: flagellar biosynthetic protein FliR [Acidimicrobiia bacterium]